MDKGQLQNILAQPVGTSFNAMDSKIAEIISQKKEELGIENKEPEKEPETIEDKLEPKPDATQTTVTEVEVVKPSYGIGDLIKENIQLGKWQDLEFESNEGVVTKVSEMDNFTEEQIKTILAEQDKIKEEEIKNSFVSIQDLTEEQKAVIELIKVGGKDIANAFQDNPYLARAPFSDEDLETYESRARVYVQSMVEKGVPEQDAINLASIKEQNGDLYGEAFAIRNQYGQEYLKNIESMKQEILQENQKIQEQEKQFKKGLKTVLLRQGYDQNKADKLVNIAVDKEGDKFKIDDLYFSAMADPEKAYKIIELLTDPEGFENRLRASAVTAANLNTMSELRRVRATSTSAKTTKAMTDTNPKVTFTLSR